MVERTGSKFKLSSLSPVERMALYSTILIWAGVIASGIGLLIALNNLHIERIAYAEIAAITSTVTTTETATPAPTAPLYPAGWSTSTPTPPWKPTSTPILTSTPDSKPTHTAASEASSGTSTPVDAGEDVLPTSTPDQPPSLYPPDRLIIPSIDLDSPVVPIGWTSVEQGDEATRVWAVADNVVGWHKTSAHPGSNGNVVLNGHHNIKGEVFRYLVDVEVGDRIRVHARDQVYNYAVAEKHILKEKGEPIEVRRQNAQWIASTTDERLTMITCWPYTNNTHRLVVVAQPVHSSAQEGIERSQEP